MVLEEKSQANTIFRNLLNCLSYEALQSSETLPEYRDIDLTLTFSKTVKARLSPLSHAAFPLQSLQSGAPIPLAAIIAFSQKQLGGGSSLDWRRVICHNPTPDQPQIRGLSGCVLDTAVLSSCVLLFRLFLAPRKPFPPGCLIESQIL